MELFKYIVRFFYRIRWWMVIFPCIAGVIAWFMTRDLEKTYDVKTTIFTGIISGYNVDVTDSRNAGVHLSNLMNIITTERTLKIVSLKLLARCLVYGDAEKNTSYISAEHYQQLVGSVPREMRALIDKQNEEKTYNKLVAFERPSVNNFIYRLLNYTHPYFSIPLLSQNIKVARLGNSDMIEIAYSSNDPGIAYNTLDILNEEFVKQYHELRYGETDNVIKFFQEELARLGKMLTSAEDSLIEYNIEHRIINYGEQTKQVAGMDASYQMMDNDLLITYSTSKALIDFYEYKLGDIAKAIRTNNLFLNKLQQISQLNTKISTMEITPDQKNQQVLENEKGVLNDAEKSINDIAMQLSAESASTNNVTYETLISHGELDPEQARKHPKKNIITRALGAEKTVDIDFFDLKLEPGDVVLMCSDGLSNMVEDSQLREIISDTSTDLDEKGRILIREANRNGGKDNIAIVLVEPFTDEVKAC